MATGASAGSRRATRPWEPATGALRPGSLGDAMPRVKDRALLTGSGRYADDLPAAVGTLHTAIVRSTKAHARIVSIDTARAKGLPGVHAAITGKEIQALSDPFLVALKSPIDQWSLAVDIVRYVQQNPETAKKVVRAIVKAQNFIADPANLDEVSAIADKEYGAPGVDVMKISVERQAKTYVPFMKPEMVKKTMDLLLPNGLIEEPAPAYEELVDQSFAPLWDEYKK